MKQYVCDLEYARRLKELGIPQVGSYCWRKTGCRYTVYSIELKTIDSFIAFTSDELLTLLPKNIEVNGYCYFLNISCHIKGFWIWYESNNDNILHEMFDIKLSNAIAKLLILLKEKPKAPQNREIKEGASYPKPKNLK